MGKAFVYGDNSNTDVLFPGKYTYTVTERADMAQYALEDLDATFRERVKPGDIVVVDGSGNMNAAVIGDLLARGIRAAAEQWDLADIAVHTKGQCRRHLHNRFQTAPAHDEPLRW